jgi:hypothetical protein
MVSEPTLEGDGWGEGEMIFHHPHLNPPIKGEEIISRI